MNFHLYVALEIGLLILVIIAIWVAFREATAGDGDENKSSALSPQPSANDKEQD